jgi:hypothetical protein
MGLRRILIIAFLLFFVLQIFLFWDVITGENVRMRTYSQIKLDFSQEFTPEGREVLPTQAVRTTYKVDSIWILPFITKQMEENSRVEVRIHSDVPTAAVNGSWISLGINDRTLFSENLTWNGSGYTWNHTGPIELTVPLSLLVERVLPEIEARTSIGVEWKLQRADFLFLFFPGGIRDPFWKQGWIQPVVWTFVLLEMVVFGYCARGFLRWIRAQ